ncbi:MAG: hypothetical protein ACTHOE_10450 [Conexibacter sp.]
MRSIVRRLTSLLAIAVLAAAVAAGTASAAPTNAPNAQTVTLDCSQAGTFEVVVNGSGAWSPGHDLNSNAILIPVSFGAETTVVRDAEGNVVDESTRPAMTKGQGKARASHRNPIACTYTLSFTEDGNTITVSGSVTGFAAGRSS